MNVSPELDERCRPPHVPVVLPGEKLHLFSAVFSLILPMLGIIIASIGCGGKDSVTEKAAAGSPSPASTNGASVTGQTDDPPKEVTVPAVVSDNVANEAADALFGETVPATVDVTTNKPPAPPSVESTNRDSVQLRADLSPNQLAEFLSLTDLEIQNIASGKAGIFDLAKANAEMVRVGKLKFEASKRLAEATTSSDKQRVQGIRGQLQSLSHLAALGDLKSAIQLETFAHSQVDSDNVTVAEDSRLVLIGLGLEKIQNGSSKDAKDVMAQIDALGTSKHQPDIAAMMVLGQARAVLERYGFNDEAAQVRDYIVNLFGSHPDPKIASIALEMAGTPKFSEVEQLLRRIEQGGDLAVQEWRDTVDDLLKRSPDLSTVQFLASSALQNEAMGRTDLATASYESLQLANGLDDASKQEVALAIDARKARQEIIGQTVDFDLPSTDGRPISMTSFTGRWVLMPFWAIQFDQSLSVLQTLERIRSRWPDKVEIVGMNLDDADAPIDEFMNKSPVRFRSFHSESIPGVGVVNKIGAKFGVVSMPFVAIISPEGKVAAIDLTGQRLEETVASLIEQKPL